MTQSTGIYRIVFEAVGTRFLRLYSNADPALYKNTTQTVPNSQIPDEHWSEVVGRETDSPWQQYNQLREWADADREFVRNIQLQRMVNDPTWQVVDPEPTEGSER